jgi:uncharacterized protein (TIGR01777 family)
MTAAAIRRGEGWRVAVAGARGFVGSSLVPSLEAQGHDVIRIGRPGGKERVDVEWDPRRGPIPAAALAGIDAIVNVSGENLDRRWTREAKQRIRDSRVRLTSLLAETAAALSPRPRVLLNMSATGYYGDRGDAVLDESSPAGEGFLASVVRDWEAATQPARAAGIRVILPRSGVILHPSSGMLARLVPLIRLGGGAVIGSGRQWISWISRTDVVRALSFLLFNDALDGSVNVTSPQPVQNSEFMHTLAKLLHRPTLLTVPVSAVKLIFGQLGMETVVAGQRAVPRRLTEAGFEFQLPALEPALRRELADR